MRTKKRWVLGTISGFFFGLFLGLTLLGFGVFALDSAALTILPIAGLLVGLGGSLWGPIPPKQRPPAEPVALSPDIKGFAPTPPAEPPSVAPEPPTEAPPTSED